MSTLKFSFVLLTLVLLVCCTAPLATEPTGPPPATGLSSNLQLKKVPPLYNLEQIGDVVNPFTKQPVKIAATGDLLVSGWAVDVEAKDLGKGVDVVIDGTPLAANYPSDRGDVATFYKNPAYAKAGFQLVMPASDLSKGAHSLLVRIITKDGTAYYQGLPVAIVVE
jgi:hypothetical protein